MAIYRTRPRRAAAHSVRRPGWPADNSVGQGNPADGRRGQDESGGPWAALLTGQPPDDEVARWLAKRDTVMADKLAAVGLIPRRGRATLQAFIDSYIESRTDVKLRTKWTYEATRQDLLDFFGADKSLRDITPGDADDWRLRTGRQRAGRKHGSQTDDGCPAVPRRGQAEAADRREPVCRPQGGLQANPSRFYFISPEEAQRVWTPAPTPSGDCCSL